MSYRCTYYPCLINVLIEAISEDHDVQVQEWADKMVKCIGLPAEKVDFFVAYHFIV